MKHYYHLIFSACFFLCFPIYGHASDDGSSFAYDAAGNRVSRSIVLASPLATSPEGRSLDSAVFVPETPQMFYHDGLKETDLRIYPNPTQGQLAVEIVNPNPKSNYLITVHSAQGKLVFQKASASGYTAIDLRSQARGLYLLRIIDGKDFLTWKIIKE